MEKIMESKDVKPVGILVKNYILLRFADATLDANGSYHFQFNSPVQNVVGYEWLNVSDGLVKTMVYIKEFENETQTTSNFQTANYSDFWRFINENNNYVNQNMGDPYLTVPKPIYTLTVLVMNTSGTPQTLHADDYIHLVLWSR